MPGGALPCAMITLQLLRGLEQARDHLSRRDIVTKGFLEKQGPVGVKTLGKPPDHGVSLSVLGTLCDAPLVSSPRSIRERGQV